MSIDWGAVPEWIAGAGAVVALIFARSAAKSARRASDLQATQLEELRADNKRREDVDRRYLASQVGVYIVIDLASRTPLPIVYFTNSGGLPVYELTIHCFTPTVIVERNYFVHRSGPDRHTMRTISNRLAELVSGADLRALIIERELVAACSFRDSAGGWWYRSALGELVEAVDGDSARSLARQSGPSENKASETLDGVR